MALRLLARVHGRYKKLVGEGSPRRPLRMRNASAIVSFSFDDFPVSAIRIAGPMLRAAGAHGTYYTSLGLMGTTAPTGRIFERPDLEAAIEAGHELGCHTFGHRDAWNTEGGDFDAAIRSNQEALARIAPQARFESFAYPISGPSRATKRVAANYYECSRAGGQTFNQDGTDLNLLKAFFIEMSVANPDRMRATIEACVAARGWLVFATHDVEENPTRYGCTPGLFERVLRWSVDSGARILPVAGALRTIRTEAGASA